MWVMTFLIGHIEILSEGVLRKNPLWNTFINSFKLRLMALGWRGLSCFHTAALRERVNTVSLFRTVWISQLQHDLDLKATYPHQAFQMCCEGSLEGKLSLFAGIKSAPTSVSALLSCRKGPGHAVWQALFVLRSSVSENGWPCCIQFISQTPFFVSALPGNG